MTIGPLPTTSTFLMSSRRGKALQEAVEQVERVVRSGPRLGVVLHGARRHVLQDQSLDGAVVEVQLRQLGSPEVGLLADRLVGVDRPIPVWTQYREAVVLGGDVDPAALEVLYWVVRSAVAEGQLER